MRNLMFFILVFLVACQAKNGSQVKEPVFYTVYATIETEPVQESDDAADDPAIWIHPDETSKSLIIGTNKQRGLNVYNLDGKFISTLDCGRINNVDVRYNFPLLNDTIDIAAGTNRSDSTIAIVKIDGESGELYDITSRKIRSEVGEVYGFCLYYDIRNKNYYAFVNSKSGKVEQWLLFATEEGKIDASMVRSFSLDGQTEGCVADDELGYLYIGQENKGIWKYDAHPDSSNKSILIDDTTSLYLKTDIEGITIFYTSQKTGYLIVSSQGNNSYAVYERKGDNKYLGSFMLGDREIDGTSDTDGIDVCNLNLGDNFPNGIFVAQDGYNYDQDVFLNQNFKYIPWESISEVFEPPLTIDNKFNIRDL